MKTAIALAAVTLMSCGGGGGENVQDTQEFIVSAPIIAFVTPGEAKVGGSFEVSGENFGAAQGTSTLTVGGVAAAITSCSDMQIQATVPSGVQSNQVQVTVDGRASNAVVPAILWSLENPVNVAVCTASQDRIRSDGGSARPNQISQITQIRLIPWTSPVLAAKSV